MLNHGLADGCFVLDFRPETDPAFHVPNNGCPVAPATRKRVSIRREAQSPNAARMPFKEAKSLPGLDLQEFDFPIFAAQGCNSAVGRKVHTIHCLECATIRR